MQSLDEEPADIQAIEAQEAAEVIREVAPELEALAEHAFAHCVPTARDAARRFLPSERFDLYAFLASDATGRLAQLATVCPGALLLFLALRRGGAVDATDQAAAAIAQGRPLRWVLDALADGWAECLAPGSTPPARMREVRLRQRPTANRDLVEDVVARHGALVAKVRGPGRAGTPASRRRTAVCQPAA